MSPAPVLPGGPRVPTGDLSWQAHAACRDAPGVHFFFELHGYPSRAERAAISAAQAVCQECPVREPCLELGLAHSADVVAGSVWGGVYLSQRGARRLQRERAGSEGRAAA